MENVFIKVAEGKDQGSMTETIYKMDTVQKNLLNTFLEGRNNALLFSKGNIDENGKATIVDPQTNRPSIYGSYTSNSILKISLIAGIL